MNVWVKLTRKKATCYYCGRDIETGTFQIVCQYYMPVRGGKIWTKRMLFHTVPNCWLNRAIAELESRSVLETRGRKANNLNDSAKEARNKILRRRASIVQRIDKEMLGEIRPMKLRHLIGLIEKLKIEIEPYGGVPETWS